MNDQKWIQGVVIAALVGTPLGGIAQTTQSAGSAVQRESGAQAGSVAEPIGTQQRATQQHQQQSERQTQGTRAQPQAAGMQQQGSQQVSGRVTGVRTITLQGEAQPHLLARVELASGETRVLDLGPIPHLQQQKRDVKKGQQLSASGQAGRINDLAVLVVDRFEGDGVVTVIPIAANASQQRQQAQRGANPHDRLVRGRIESLRESTVQGGKAHQLARIRTDQGQTVVVDLGEQKPQALQLEQGDALIAVGAIGRLNGKPVLFAERVAEVAQIERSGATSGASASREGSSSSATPQQRASSRP